MSDTVLTERRGKVLLITLNRPDARNSVNRELADAMTETLQSLDADAGLAAGVITGAGRGFSAGMDLKAFAEGNPPMVPGRGFAGITEESCVKPLVAAVEGFALAGGLEIALACDILVAAKGTRLGIPETGVGLFAGAGALLRLPRNLPLNLAMEMALTAEPITAERAQEFGMVNRLTEPGETVAVAVEIAERIARNAPLGVAASKRILQEMKGQTNAEFWKMNNEEFARITATEDAMEGAKAFAEKREPNWQGR